MRVFFKTKPITALRVNDHYNYCPRQRPITPLGTILQGRLVYEKFYRAHFITLAPETPEGEVWANIVSHWPLQVLGSGRLSR